MPLSREAYVEAMQLRTRLRDSDPAAQTENDSVTIE